MISGLALVHKFYKEKELEQKRDEKRDEISGEQ